MKKLIAISILLTLLTAAAFAQFGFKITGEFYPDLLVVQAPTGDAIDPTIPKTQNGKVPYLGSGTVDIFTRHNWPAGKGLTALFSYAERVGEGETQRYGGQLGISMGYLLSQGEYLFSKSDVSDRFTGVPFVQLLSSGIGDWDLWGKVGIFSGKVGNTGAGGSSVVNYDAPFNFLMDGVTYNDYGIILPNKETVWDTTSVYTIGSGTNIRDLKPFPVAQTSGGSPSLSDRPTFSVTADLAPIKVTVAGDMSNLIHGNAVDAYSHSTVGGGILVSGDKIADLVSFDATYKFAGGDYDTESKAKDKVQPNGDGSWGHAFGLYANLGLIDTLGIGVGYSGFMSVQEKLATSTDEYAYRLPYYNGVNLHFNFTGVDKLNISLNNNISFATIKGTDDAHIYTTGIGGDVAAYKADWNSAKISQVGLQDSDISDGYLALSNALGVKYQLSDPLYVSFQLANRLFSYTKTAAVNQDRGRGEKAEESYGADRFRVALGTGYSFGDHVSLATGLTFDLLSYTHKDSQSTDGLDNWSFGEFTFAIPVYFKVVLP